ncbi:hypothetical protein PG997_008718 [Apiospora hydei]|uniref:Uncharacterized protein n=1 Tax=Apiospora hydei TaxID=1337664 RepID=A0ABR1WEK7_9PEZI
MIAAVRDIRKDEEITIPYTDPIAVSTDRRLNLAPAGFADPQTAMGIAIAHAHMLKNTGITGQILDET